MCFQSSATPLPLCTSAPAPPTDAPAFYLLISSLQYICLPVSLALCQIVCVPYLTFQHYSTFPSPAWPPLWITCLIPGPLYRLLPVGYCSLRTNHLAPDLGSVFWIFPSPTPYWFCLLWTDYLVSDPALKINQFFAYPDSASVLCIWVHACHSASPDMFFHFQNHLLLSCCLTSFGCSQLTWQMELWLEMAATCKNANDNKCTDKWILLQKQ